MKYKVKDKVKIKAWKELEKEYGVSSYAGNIKCNYFYFVKDMEKALEKLNCNRILTIDSINDNNDCYKMKELPNWYWTDRMIKCLTKDNKSIICEPINSRFEILDIR